MATSLALSIGYMRAYRLLLFDPLYQGDTIGGEDTDLQQAEATLLREEEERRSFLLHLEDINAQEETEKARKEEADKQQKKRMADEAEQRRVQHMKQQEQAEQEHKEAKVKRITIERNVKVEKNRHIQIELEAEQAHILRMKEVEEQERFVARLREADEKAAGKATAAAEKLDMEKKEAEKAEAAAEAARKAAEEAALVAERERKEIAETRAREAKCKQAYTMG